MPHFTNFTRHGAGVVLLHKNGSKFCPSVMAAEQLLLTSINCWAEKNVKNAREEMALLTSILRTA